MRYLQIEKMIMPGNLVWIKPNMFQGFSSEKAVTTHPSIIKALVQLLQQQNVKIVIGDNPACLKSNSMNEYLKIAELTGIKQVVETTDSKLIYPDNKVKVSGWEVAEIALEADIIINIPKLKGHGLMGFTGAVKNIFGVIPGLCKLDFHAQLQKRDEFAEMLVNLCDFIRPHLTIMDAVKVVDEEGSISHPPKLTKALIASKDPFAVDLVAANLCGLNPKSIPTLKAILKKDSNLTNIKIIGRPLKKFKTPHLNFPVSQDDLQHSKKQALSSETLRPFPVINSEKCKNCGKCLMICPARAIRVRDEKLILRKKLCIKCYACIEVCRFGAIRIDKTIF